MDWYVIYTKPKWEIKVAEDLQKKKIEAYCPTITEIRQWSDRKKKVSVPLFKSFVFIKLNEKERNKAFKIPGVIRYLFWLQKPAIVKNEEIEIIKKWLDDENFEDIDISRFDPGDEVTISEGSFKGQKALVSQSGKKRLRLILKSLNCVVNVNVKDVD